MKHIIERDYLSPRFREQLHDPVSEHVSDFDADPRSVSVAKPLLDAGLYWAAIVRRGLLKEKAPTSSPRYQFMLLLEGEMQVKIRGTWRKVHPGQLLFIPQGTYVPKRFDSRIWAIYCVFNETVGWGTLKQRGAYARDYEHADILFLHMRQMLDAKLSADPKRWQIARQSARYLLFLLHHEVSLAQTTSSSRDPELDRLMDAIELSPQSNWAVEEMAKQANISPTQFHVIFRERFGITPTAAVMERRMWRAGERLVATEESIETIAESVGYQSASSFSRLFKRSTGLSPGQYRKKKREEHDRETGCHQ